MTTRKWPWDSFPEDGSTWETCLEKYDALQNRCEEMEEELRCLRPIDEAHDITRAELAQANARIEELEGKLNQTKEKL